MPLYLLLLHIKSILDFDFIFCFRLRCGCDTVWLIRGLKTSHGKQLSLAYKVFFCKADKAKGVSKAVPLGRATEAQFCPLKGLY